ncbi:hypothetical protein MP228_009751 [Amoeboaphelidium protococcarum]|nr:hypothetical protein MP228_009751 [Amoeboaphelidium protococcarum]
MSQQQQRKKYILGIAAMDQKARSKPMRNILQRVLQFNESNQKSSANFELETVIFGDKVLLDEPIESWPSCDFLISFHSTGFPLQKAIDYVQKYRPFCINDLVMQKLIFDRRIVLMLLDCIGSPTPPRLVVSRDGGAKMPADVLQSIRDSRLLLKHNKQIEGTDVVEIDRDTIEVNGQRMVKPFVEKPINGEDHNVWIYYHSSTGGGVRKLFRKVANKSSAFFAEDIPLRRDGSYIYEQFMDVDNAEDVKVYTIGPDYAHAETRKSPVVDGIVRRNPDGKEMRYVTQLTKEEQTIARNVSMYFKQRICGLDLLRVNGKSYVIDVNGWSFVKGNENYYNVCAQNILQWCLSNRRRYRFNKKDTSFENQWTLKGYLSVMRHADRTPKQKLKFYTASQPFANLLGTSTVEILLKKPEELQTVIDAAIQARDENLENREKMDQLVAVLENKMLLAGTKVQIKPFFSKEDGLLEKLQIIVKWGGEFTHAGAHHSKDLGENLRKDLMLVNKDLLSDVQVYASSERRVLATTDVFLKAFMNDDTFDSTSIVTVRKDMLDDSFDAKEQMEVVKTKLYKLLNAGYIYDMQFPDSMTLPEGMEDPPAFARELIGLLLSRRDVMKKKFEDPAVNQAQSKWCCNESPTIFKERWDRLFRDLCDSSKSLFDPSKVPELYDSMKYDALHNREFIDYVFVDENEDISDKREPLRKMYHHAKLLFDLIAPCEYGITFNEKLEIGVLTSFVLLKQLVADLQAIAAGHKACTKFYFTKESHVHTLYNVIRQCLSPNSAEVVELDYLTQITFELYERKDVLGSSSGSSSVSSADNGGSGDFMSENDLNEYSLRIGLSPGAHDPGLIDTQMDERHALAVQPRYWLTDHLPLDDAIRCIMPNLNTPRPSPRCSPKLQLRSRNTQQTHTRDYSE